MPDAFTYREVDISTDMDTATKYSVQASPTIVVLDGDGRVVDAVGGVPDKDRLRSIIEQARGK